MKLISQPSKGKEKGSHCTSAVVSVMVLNFSPCGVARSGREQGAVSRAGRVCGCCWSPPHSLCLVCYLGNENGGLLVAVSTVPLSLLWEIPGLLDTEASHCITVQTD